MLSKYCSIVIAGLVLSMILSAAAFAAGPPNEYATVSGSVCTVAGVNGDPNHQFDVRATGAYNRGTSGNLFAICPFTVTPTPVEGGALINLNLSAFTADGQPHDMTCTAVIGSLNRPTQPVYASKTMTITGPSANDPTVITWAPDDFGGASPSGGIVGSAWGTITCLLPPQTAVALMYARLNDTIE